MVLEIFIYSQVYFEYKVTYVYKLEKKMFMCTYIKLCLKSLLKNNLNFLYNGNPFKIFWKCLRKI